MKTTAVAKNSGATPGPESRSAIHLCHLDNDDDDDNIDDDIGEE